jgi:chorismate mutase
LKASGLSVGLPLGEKTESISELRKHIERVTMEILNLCGERLQLAKQIGEIKAREGIAIENAKIEQKLKIRVLEQCKKYGLNEKFGLKLLQLLLEESKQVQRDAIKT